MSVEVMLNAAGLAFIVAGSAWHQADGQVMFIFILAMAAAEVSVGLALIIQLFKRFKSVDIENASTMKGLKKSDEMKELLWLIVALPFSGALILALAGKKLSRIILFSNRSGNGFSFLPYLTIFAGFDFLSGNPAGKPYLQVLWHWFDVGGLSPDIAFHLDTVSLTFIFVITFVGALIHLYSAGFMRKRRRIFPLFYLYEFVHWIYAGTCSGQQFTVVYLGWEGVGLCSYLLIGFWYKNPDNGYAARKAFIVTRVGDTALAVGLFIFFMNFGTLNIQDILELRSCNVGCWLGNCNCCCPSFTGRRCG